MLLLGVRGGSLLFSAYPCSQCVSSSLGAALEIALFLPCPLLVVDVSGHLIDS